MAVLFNASMDNFNNPPWTWGPDNPSGFHFKRFIDHTHRETDWQNTNVKLPSIVSPPGATDNAATRFELTYANNETDFRSEVMPFKDGNNSFRLAQGNEYWIACRIWIAAGSYNPTNTNNPPITIFQLHKTPYPQNAPSGGPNFILNLVQGGLWIRNHINGDLLNLITPIPNNVWMNFLWNVNVSHSSNGFCRLYHSLGGNHVNTTPLFNHSGRTLRFPTYDGMQLRFGIYHGNWNKTDQNNQINSNTIWTIHDHIRIGDANEGFESMQPWFTGEDPGPPPEDVISPPKRHHAFVVSRN